MPSRIIKKSACNMPGLFPSLKNREGIMFESTVERDYCYYLELDQSVSFYEAQPLTLEFRIDGKARRYTPDFLVLFIDSGLKLLVEVKREEALLDDDGMLIKLNVVREEFKKRGYKFEVKEKSVIRQEPRLGNLKIIYKYLRYQIDIGEKKMILELLQGGGKYQISEVGLVTSIDDPLPKVLHLASRSELLIDLSSPIDAYSLIWSI